MALQNGYIMLKYKRFWNCDLTMWYILFGKDYSKYKDTVKTFNSGVTFAKALPIFEINCIWKKPNGKGTVIHIKNLNYGFIRVHSHEQKFL